jgi:hypothetical protein
LPEVRHEGRRGYMLPALGPAPSSSELLRKQVQIIRGLIEMSSDAELAFDVA